MVTLYRKSALRGLFFWILEVILVVVLAFTFSRGFCRTVTTQDASMAPTLSSGQTALINSAGYILGTPQRGDVVAFRLSEGGSLYVRRIIGIPGDTVQIVNGQILVNGEIYIEKIDLPTIEDAGLAEEPMELDSGEYFVLGDNRNAAEDSRAAVIGNIRRTMIVGKVWFRISPIGSLGRVR